jgi:hypothetical protein
MTPSINKAIADEFPEHSRSKVLGIVESLGRGRAHARSAFLYNCIIRSSRGSIESLVTNTRTAVQFPERFADYCERWYAWTRTASRFDDDYELAAFLRPLMLNIASVACWHQFHHNTSHSTLCLCSISNECRDRRLFVKPWYGKTICIYYDSHDYFDIAFESGTFASGSDAELLLLSEIQRLFPMKHDEPSDGPESPNGRFDNG